MRGLCARACACVHVQVHVLQRACVARVYKYIIHIYNVDVRGVDVMWRGCNVQLGNSTQENEDYTLTCVVR